MGEISMPNRGSGLRALDKQCNSFCGHHNCRVYLLPLEFEKIAPGLGRKMLEFNLTRRGKAAAPGIAPSRLGEV
jgi:hypothetical protein